MTSTVLDTELRNHRSIDLDELVRLAALQTRVDRKYVLAREEANSVLSDLDPATRVLEIDGIRRVDLVMAVSAPRAVQIHRVALRRRMDRAQIAAVIARQMPDLEKRLLKDFGMKFEKEEWLEAWSMPEPAKKE